LFSPCFINANCCNGKAHEAFLTIFFFQAEDGIRAYKVTGVQTCALPISSSRVLDFCSSTEFCHCKRACGFAPYFAASWEVLSGRSEERRVGKGCRSGASP